MSRKLNDYIRVADGREGTICYHNLDGDGGVWGRHTFTMPKGGFGDELPMPQFLLREPELQPLMVRNGHRPDVECVGTRILYEDEFDDADARRWLAEPQAAR